LAPVFGILLRQNAPYLLLRKHTEKVDARSGFEHRPRRARRPRLRYSVIGVTGEKVMHARRSIRAAMDV
jgi:hypothetical protein